jgi:hypothetical protein
LPIAYDFPRFGSYGRALARKGSPKHGGSDVVRGGGRTLGGRLCGELYRKRETRDGKSSQRLPQCIGEVGPTDKTVLNLLGNCPEFITWSIVCRNAGNYKSLCLSNFKEFAYKFCGHCKDASVAFSEKKYEIEDFFDKSSLLFSTEVMTDQAYPGCKLKTAQAICQPAACENGVLVESESTYGFIIFYSLCICILMNHGVERLNFPHLHGD